MIDRSSSQSGQRWRMGSVIALFVYRRKNDDGDGSLSQECACGLSNSLRLLLSIERSVTR